MDDLTYSPLGVIRLRAQVIVEARRAAGLKVELLASDDHGNVYLHRLLARVDELERVLAVIEESESD